MVQDLGYSSVLETLLPFYGVLAINESKVYTEIKNEPSITYDALVEKTDIPRRTIARVIASLESKGFIERKGTKKDNWTILK